LRKDCDVRYYNRQDFKNLSKISLGGFSSVHTAEWKNTRAKYAIKKFAKGSTEEEIINEVCL
jgi:serine/threonine protein kinase